jgi:hypothetical protein
MYIAAMAEEVILGEDANVPVQQYSNGFSAVNHEFAHPIYDTLDVGKKKAIRVAYDRKWNKEFEWHENIGWDPEEWADGLLTSEPRPVKLKAKAKFKNINYSATNEFEYFAQTANAYMGTNNGNDLRTGLKKNSGAKWVKKHEPSLFPIMVDLFGDLTGLGEGESVFTVPVNPLKEGQAEADLYEGFREFWFASPGGQAGDAGLSPDPAGYQEVREAAAERGLVLVDVLPDGNTLMGALLVSAGPQGLSGASTVREVRQQLASGLQADLRSSDRIPKILKVENQEGSWQPIIRGLGTMGWRDDETDYVAFLILGGRCSRSAIRRGRRSFSPVSVIAGWERCTRKKISRRSRIFLSRPPPPAATAAVTVPRRLATRWGLARFRRVFSRGVLKCRRWGGSAGGVRVLMLRRRGLGLARCGVVGGGWLVCGRGM